MGASRISRISARAGRARALRSAAAPKDAAFDSRTSTRTATPTAPMMTAATWKGRFQVSGMLCFHVVMTVALMTRLASVPNAVVSTSAFNQRLRPKTSGTTATLVRVNTEAAWRAMTMNNTRSQ